MREFKDKLDWKELPKWHYLSKDMKDEFKDYLNN
jgi:hypothetical protein